MFWSSTTPAGQALLCTMVLGIMVSSFYALAPCRVVFGANLCATVLSVLASLWAVGDGAFARMIAIIFPAFSLIIFSYGLQLSAKYRRAVALGFENEHMTRVLAHAKRTAEQANLAKSRFLANMSHELRTPLNAIIGFSEVIRDRMFGPQADKYSEYAADVVTSARHLLNLIQGVLDLAKIEAGKMAFERTQFVIGPLLADCARAMRAGALDKGLDLLLDDTSAGCLVYADETAIRQIGCGIPKHVLPRMFLPFERADNSFSASQGGTGLGLALVQHLAQAHGGSCHVESTPGQGTTFRISMPIVSNESMMAAA
jgi:two-component system cell cycle sensor histidine kinase PleC